MFVPLVTCSFCGSARVHFFVECHLRRLGLLMPSCGCCADSMLVLSCNLVCRPGIWYEMKCRSLLNPDFLSARSCTEYCPWSWTRTRLTLSNWILGEGRTWFNTLISLIFFTSLNYVFWSAMEQSVPLNQLVKWTNQPTGYTYHCSTRWRTIRVMKLCGIGKIRNRWWIVGIENQDKEEEWNKRTLNPPGHSRLLRSRPSFKRQWHHAAACGLRMKPCRGKW